MGQGNDQGAPGGPVHHQRHECQQGDKKTGKQEVVAAGHVHQVGDVVPERFAVEIGKIFEIVLERDLGRGQLLQGCDMQVGVVAPGQGRIKLGSLPGIGPVLLFQGQHGVDPVRRQTAPAAARLGNGRDGCYDFRGKLTAFIRGLGLPEQETVLVQIFLDDKLVQQFVAAHRQAEIKVSDMGEVNFEMMVGREGKTSCHDKPGKGHVHAEPNFFSDGVGQPHGIFISSGSLF